MENKIKESRIFITGANGGIGKEVVRMLIQEKANSVALACRTESKAEKVKIELENSNTKLEAYGEFDMSNEGAIKRAVSNLPNDQQFDIVFLQSGGMVVADDFQFVKSKDIKIEKTIYQNTLGAYITLKHLFEKNLIKKNARIVFPGGEGARGIKGMIKKPEFQSVKELKKYIHQGLGKYRDIDALGVSKFVSALLVHKLATLDFQREYIWFSPGLTAQTNGLRDVPSPKRFIMEKIGFPLMTLFGLAQKPNQAAKKYIDCLNGIYGKSGELIGAPEGKALGKLVDQKPMNPGLTNYQFIEAFWNITVKSCGGFSHLIKE